MADLEVEIETRFSLKEIDKENEIIDKENKLKFIAGKYHRLRDTLIQSAAAVSLSFGGLSGAESISFTAQHDMTLNVKTVAASSVYGIGSGATFHISRSPTNKIIALEGTNQIGIETNDIDLELTN